MTDDIVKRLLEDAYPEPTELEVEAADEIVGLRSANSRLREEIAKLRAENKALTEQSWVIDGALLSEREENEKLRAALKPFSDWEKEVLGSYHFDKMPDDKMMITTGDGGTDKWIYRQHLRAAKAALGESDE